MLEITASVADAKITLKKIIAYPPLIETTRIPAAAGRKTVLRPPNALRIDLNLAIDMTRLLYAWNMFQVGTTDHSGHPIQQDNHGLVPAYDKKWKTQIRIPTDVGYSRGI